MRELKFRCGFTNHAPMIFSQGEIDAGAVLNMLANGSGEIKYRDQYTGLHDKNGVEIYEGDIVEFTYWWFDGNPAEASLTGAIEYLPESMSFAMAGIKNADWLKHVGGDVDTTPFAFFRFEGDDFRVIGNIHQNPDLIP